MNKIKILRDKFNELEIDGYIVPKNDQYFSEYAKNDRLKNISNFSGSAGIAVILKKKIIYLLMVDILSRHIMNQLKILKSLKYIRTYLMQLLKITN